MEPRISMLIIFFFIAVLALCVDSTSRDTVSLLESSPSPPPPPPPPPPLPPPPPPPSLLSPPPPSPSLKSPTPPRRFSPHLNQNSSGHRWRSNHSRRKPRSSPAAAKHKLNRGEKVGLSFVGIVSVLQVFVVGFLVFKRRQLLKVANRCEISS